MPMHCHARAHPHTDLQRDGGEEGAADEYEGEQCHMDKAELKPWGP